jgi:hypothetical protein
MAWLTPRLLIANLNSLQDSSRRVFGYLRELNPHCRYPFDLTHVVVFDRRAVAVIPVNGNVAPRRFYNRADIIRCGAPANPVAHFKKSRLFARHRVSAA